MSTAHGIVAAWLMGRDSHIMIAADGRGCLSHHSSGLGWSQRVPEKNYYGDSVAERGLFNSNSADL
ncbi:MAG TPA: hypothetical protein VM802_23805 [Chitinophaga sp.]|uniref:hypothetical protein n=1 Tax=Chitinophaga sp. TaxID=1869181 RepID=UPI002C55F6E6|nr:hypothetical protein [Chitinophaga sp.]HVI47914.1 hypothetical protein [Chitinophaga sp.]